MLNFIICDDNKPILERLSKMLESIFMQNDIDAKVSFTCTSPDELYNHVKNNSVDVLFLDIDLKDKTTGIDLANSIRKFNKDVYIIFTSAHMEYILLAYQCKTFDFLPKPITRERLAETIDRLMDDINGNKKSNSFLRLNSKNTIINQDNINFIKRDGMKLVFYTDTRTYEAYTSFNKISKDLSSNFVRCHKSYVANINKISNVNMADNSISFNEFHHKDKCFIGPKYKNKLMEVLNNGNITNNMDSYNK